MEEERFWELEEKRRMGKRWIGDEEISEKVTGTKGPVQTRSRPSSPAGATSNRS
jgi:hypothetical protein